MSRDNLQMKRAFVLGVPPTVFLTVNVLNMLNIYDSRSGASDILPNGKSLLTPHTTEKSEKIIFRTTKIIGTLPRIVGKGLIGPKSAR